jgi:lysozyme
MDDKSLFDYFRKKKQQWSGKPQARLTQNEVDELNGVLRPEEAPIVITAPTQPKSSKGPLGGIVGAVAATFLLTFVPTQEGTAYKAYKDIAGVWTICQGDTKDVHAGLIETPAGCQKRLEMQLVAHAKGMMLCTPTLEGEGKEWLRAAGTDLTYNIGIGGFCKSSINKKWMTQQWWSGCQGFIAWNKARVKGVLQPVKGLTLRRQREIQICGTNLVEGWTPENLKQRVEAIK